MKLGDLTLDSLDLVQGMEKRLRQRRRSATASLALAGGGFLLQFLLAATDESYAKNLAKVGDFALAIVHRDFSALLSAETYTPEVVGGLIVVAGVLGFLLLRWTGALFRESDECFRYSFDVSAFMSVDGTPGARCTLENEDRLKLLHLDLTERLNGRIRRLSILDADKAAEVGSDNKSLTAHIHIDGLYVVRETENGRWVVQVTSNVRIGGKDRPSTQSAPVRYELRPVETTANETGTTSATPRCRTITAQDYMQLVERVYSRVATEVYRQIESDIQSKITLFPTAYLRAVALSREAEDFLRSNTIDAYDRALELYRQALGHFNVTDVTWATSALAKMPLLWRWEAGFIRRKAAVVTGYAKCAIYRRRLSTLTGRTRNSLFEVPALLDEAVDRLETLHRHVTRGRLHDLRDKVRTFLTFPRDRWDRAVLRTPGELFYEKQRKALFDALAVRALAWVELNAMGRAEKELACARAVDPLASERDPIYLLAAAEIEPCPDLSIRHVEKATELAPEFQIAKFRLAQYHENRFRFQDELKPDNAGRVLKAYDEVLGLNPGNVKALVAQGHIHWLLEGPACEEKFQQGLELKFIVEETFVGELSYGLARAAAEDPDGCFRCYDLYCRAIAADPGIAACSQVSTIRNLTDQFDCIGDAMMRRMERYKEKALAILSSDRAIADCSPRTRAVVKSFVLNDYANACFNYQFRLGRPSYLRQAIKAYDEACQADPENAVARYNLAQAKLHRDEFAPDAISLLDKAESLAPTWPAVRSLAAMTELRPLKAKIERAKKDLAAADSVSEETTKSPRLAKAQAQAGKGLELGGPAGPDPRLLADMPVDQTKERRRQEADEHRRKAQQAIDEASVAIRNKVIKRLGSAISETRVGLMVDLSIVGWEGGGVELEELRSVDRRLIDENDLQVLLLWARVLWLNSASPMAWRDARLLSTLHESYYPEDLDRDIPIRDAFMELTQLGTTDGEDELRAENRRWLDQQASMVRERTRRQVFRWIKADEVHCGALGWLASIEIKADEAKHDLFGDALPTTGGACVQLAHLYLAENRVADAIAAYEEAVKLLGDEDDYYYELANACTRAGDHKTAAGHYRSAIRVAPENAEYHHALASALRDFEQWQEACDAERDALALEPDNERFQTGLVLIYNAWGNSLYEDADYKSAAKQYQEAVDIDDSDPVILSNLALALEEDTLDSSACVRAIALLERAVELKPDAADYARRLDSLRAFGVKSSKRLPLVTPIALEVAADLIRHIVTTGDALSPVTQAAIARMREGIRSRFGVEIPGIRIRGNEADLPAGTYVISVMDVPRVMGTAPSTKLYVREPSDRLTSRGIGAEPASDAWSEAQASWVVTEDAELLTRFRIASLTPVDYMFEHLCTVVEQNLPQFVGVQETQLLVEKHCPSRKEELAASPSGLPSVTAVLRALLAEQVPITPLEPLVETILSLAKTRGLTDVVEASRRLPNIRSKLPGNDSTATWFALDPAFEKALRSSVSGAGGSPVLAMSPDLTQQALTAVRDHVSGRGLEALVVSDPVIRSHVRKLVELEFPKLHVLARDEILADLSQRPSQVILLS